MSRAGAFEAVLLMILVLLSTVMILVVLDGPDRVSVHGDWNITGDGPVSKIFMAEDGTVYLFGGPDGNTVSAFGPDGDKKWTCEVPDQWLVSKQAFAVDDGTVYLYLYENDFNTTRYGRPVNYGKIVDRGYWTDGNRSIMAISRHGKMLWHADVPNGISFYGTSLYASGGRVYYYNNDSVLVIDAKGRMLFNVSDIYGPPTVDEHGNVYVAKMFYENGGFGPGKTIEAYHPDGTLYWRKDMGRTIYGTSSLDDTPPFNSILLYQDDSLYAWVENGTVRMATNGSIIWLKTFPYNGCAPLQAMPIDSQGNLYYLFYASPQYIDVVTPDGREILRDLVPHNATFRGNDDGVVYHIDYAFSRPIDQVGKQDLVSARISAYDILQDRILWNRTFLPAASEITVTGDDVEFFLAAGFPLHHPALNTTGMETKALEIWHQPDPAADEHVIELSPKGIICSWGIRVAPGTDALYVNYYAYNWQYPIVDPDATYVCANSLYAIADNGTLLWEKPLDSLVTSMAVNNSTLYYSTRNGGFHVENAVQIGGGLALLAIVYMLARFFLVGAVARARGRLESNPNRNSVMRYIADNPGQTARDIARDLDMNLGTIRYHLLILGLNHKLVTYKADGKFIRYFTNSKTFSEAEQQAVSIVRREGMRKVLDQLLDRPGITSRELAQALDAQESAVSRNLKELALKGIITRETKPDGSPAYFISGERRAHIAFALDRVKD